MLRDFSLERLTCLWFLRINSLETVSKPISRIHFINSRWPLNLWIGDLWHILSWQIKKSFGDNFYVTNHLNKINHTKWQTLVCPSRISSWCGTTQKISKQFFVPLIFLSQTHIYHWNVLLNYINCSKYFKLNLEREKKKFLIFSVLLKFLSFFLGFFIAWKM